MGWHSITSNTGTRTVTGEHGRRLQRIDPSRLSPEQQDVFDRIAGTRGRVPGPYTVLLHVPALADRVQSLGAYLRYEGSRDRDLAKFAILVTAHTWASNYVWNAHEPIARRAGAPDTVIDAARSGGDSGNMPARFRVVCEYARDLSLSGSVSDEVYESAATLLGIPGVIELTVLVGYYGLISMTVNAIDTAAGPEET